MALTFDCSVIVLTFLQNPSQMALMGNIAAAFTACQAAQQGFTTRTDLPPLGSDAVSDLILHYHAFRSTAS